MAIRQRGRQADASLLMFVPGSSVMFLIKLLFTVVVADFLSGLVHWLEDAYARPGMPLVGRIAEENLRHHARPRVGRDSH